ncbi:disintegrin and metalloproteinase domain-containing protein 20 [Eptesicus fuscus]|uniref:disintegrin and metalloproteinase domain-containing protein 20 n=1 Tax=Eptesicus fuscus TaxID=29078 RepID=UPI0024042701|nr:disintegrin and metalloproteinase domain-containing protein 20 [Eptesicus fuscus]
MAVGEALVHIKVTLLLLWFGVSLSISGHSQARRSQRFSKEVVIPLKVTSRDRDAKAPGWLSYSLRFGGQRHIVHMRVKKFLVSRHLPVFTYTDQHALQEDQPFVPDDCYYHGYVQGVPGSLVALSTCSGGFRGILQINDLAYEIEPIRHSSTFEHLVYKIDSDDVQFPPMRCGLTEEKIARQLELQELPKSTLMQSSYVNWWTHLRFLELAIVVDHFRYVFSGSNVSLVQRELLNVVSVIDIFYTPFKLNIVLIGVEIWNQGNLVSTDDIDQLLEDFSLWKFTHLDGRLQHDDVHLVIKKSFGSKLGVAYIGGLCRKPFNSGVVVFQDHNVYSFALTVTHELGHTLGMQHDTAWCVCGYKWCIMAALKRLTIKFSNCSYAQYWDYTTRSGSCIYPPPYAGNIFRLQYCGNQVVEGGEECDCGSLKQCDQDPCCLLNCTLSPGSACAFGLCCKDCKFMPSGALCRPQINECDLPEWCNGTSHQCPEDGYVQDGIPCGDNAYCYKKSCNNRDKQCREIFGEDAKSASQECYKEINSQGSRFGHCGLIDKGYLKCNTTDIFCGRVQCKDVSVIPNLTEHTTVHQFQINFTSCWGTDYHLGITTPDIGQVKDGSVCGPGNICIHQKCVSMPLVSQDCQTDTCHTRGVCNNKQHCHCSQGWAPPNCTQKGNGGSIDSGPPPSKKEEPQAKLSYLFLLWLIPLIALFLCCFLLLCMIKKRKKEEEIEKGKETEKGKEEEVEKEKGKEKEEVEKEKEEEEEEEEEPENEEEQ